MQVRVATLVAVVWVVLVACAAEEDDPQTQLAVKNSGSASIDVTVSDGESELSFDGVAAGTTSNFKDATFSELSGLTVSVGTETSTVDLRQGERNTVDIGPDGKVAGVERAQAPSGSDEGW